MRAIETLNNGLAPYEESDLEFLRKLDVDFDLMPPSQKNEVMQGIAELTEEMRAQRQLILDQRQAKEVAPWWVKYWQQLAAGVTLLVLVIGFYSNTNADKRVFDVNAEANKKMLELQLSQKDTLIEALKVRVEKAEKTADLAQAEAKDATFALQQIRVEVARIGARR